MLSQYFLDHFLINFDLGNGRLPVAEVIGIVRNNFKTVSTYETLGIVQFF